VRTWVIRTYRPADVRLPDSPDRNVRFRSSNGFSRYFGWTTLPERWQTTRTRFRQRAELARLRSFSEADAGFRKGAFDDNRAPFLPWFLEIPGENLCGVYSANEYLTRMNLMRGYAYPKTSIPIKRHRRVAVFGGGNVAMDSARTAVRLGAEEVHIIYRRSRLELPARLEEVENAEEEGVVFQFLTLPVRLIGDEDGWVREIECLRMELGEPDASGRRKPVKIPGSEFRMPMDAAVAAIGNSPNPLIPRCTPDLKVNKNGTLVVSDVRTGKTTKDRVWAGGDVVSGAATVILAMGAGRTAARAMHEHLTGEKLPGTTPEATTR
jgi:NADPH-dependent glutamate synthase beta subunit-like oxidoreductase